MPIPSARLATNSDGADGDTPSSTIGLRWSFALQTPYSDSKLIVQTARSEHGRLTFKLPQVERRSRKSKPVTHLIDLLETPLFGPLRAQDFNILKESEPMRAFLPPAAEKEESELEIIYVHARLVMPEAFTGNDFLKLMEPRELLEHCQSYRYGHYKRAFKLFGLI